MKAKTRPARAGFSREEFSSPVQVQSLVQYDWALVARGTKGEVIALDREEFNMVHVVVKWDTGYTLRMSPADIEVVMPGRALWHT